MSQFPWDLITIFPNNFIHITRSSGFFFLSFLHTPVENSPIFYILTAAAAAVPKAKNPLYQIFKKCLFFPYPH